MIEPDARIIQAFVTKRLRYHFVENRIKRNVEPIEINVSRDAIWKVMIGCLLTTQQKSGSGSAVSRFLGQQPFPLILAGCLNDTERLTREALQNFGGIRFTGKIPLQVTINMGWLVTGGWEIIENEIGKLQEQRRRPPDESQVMRERMAARVIDLGLKGFGPKQSRNFLQWLGLTRYEIPIDSRITKWVNSNLSLRIQAEKLQTLSYYESVMDRLRGHCVEANVLPCVFDAAVFAEDDPAWTAEQLTYYN